MRIDIYIEGVKIDLFDDESIEFIQKLNDIDKLSNIFIDSSITFTIPSTPKNDDVVRHFYDSDIDPNFNLNKRLNGFIEIDTLPFRSGKFQIENGSKKENIVQYYKITFFSDLIQLTDTFKDDTLDMLDYTGLTFSSTDVNFTKTLGNDPTYLDGDIITPLISYTDRYWNIDSNDNSDISTNNGAIRGNELRQAIRVSKVVELIQDKYDINFSNDFLGQARFKNLYLWLNSSEETIKTQLITANINDFTGSPSPLVSVVTNVINFNIPKTHNFILSSLKKWKLTYSITPTNANIPYDVIVEDLDGNVLFERINVIGNFNATVGASTTPSTQNTSELRKFILKFRSQALITLGVVANAQIVIYDSIPVVELNKNTSSANTSLLATFNPSLNIPKLKVKEFIDGIMKLFKLIIRPISSNSFYIDTLNNYYLDGKILDLTEFIDISNVEISRPEIYKTISFKYLKTNNVAGKFFREYNSPELQIGYGDLYAQYDIDNKNELKVEVPLENMLFERLIDTDNETQDISIGQSIKIDGSTISKNNSKAIMFYNNGLNSHPDYLLKYNLQSVSVSPVILPLGFSYCIGNTNDMFFNQVTDSLNWGQENDPWHDNTINSSLYLNYWNNWINTIYDKRQRKYNFKAILPARIIHELSLNDRIIIEGTRYKINDFNINLTTGEAKLNLFRDIFSNESTELIQFQGKQFSPTSSIYLTDYSDSNSLGSFFIYGNFTGYDGQTATRVLKVNQDGSKDSSFLTNLGGPNQNPFGYYSLLRNDDDSLYVGGGFIQYNGVARNRFVKLLPNGAIDTSFNIGTGFNNYTAGIEKQNDGKLLICGQFTSYSGTASNRIIRLNTNGTRDNSFNTGSGFNNAALRLSLNDDNSMYVSGYFTSYNGIARNYVAKILSNGTLDTTFNTEITTFSPAGSPNPIGVLSAVDGGVYCYGYFTSYSGSTANRIIKLNPDATRDTTFDIGTGFNSNVNFVRYTGDNNLFVAGAFTQYDGTTSKGAVIISQEGRLVETFNISGLTDYFLIDNSVYAIRASDNTLIKVKENTLSIFSNSSITSSPSPRYFDVDFNTIGNYTINKVDNGDGTDWVTITNLTDKTLTFKVESGMSIMASTTQNPNVRSMYLSIDKGNTTEYLFVSQFGVLI